MPIISLKPKQMPDQPDLVLFHMQPSEWWGLYVVRPYERAIIINNGKTLKVLEGGEHDVARLPIVGLVDVIWVAQKNFKLGFYVEAYSRESIQLRFWGFTVMKVADVQDFLNNIVGGQSIFNQEALSDWIRGHITSVVRARTASSVYTDYLADRAKFIEQMRGETSKLLTEYGLSITTVEVERIKIPDDLESTLKEGAKSGIVADVLRQKGSAVSDVYKEMTKAGVNPATIEFFKALTGRDMSEVFSNLNISPQDAMGKIASQAKSAGLLGAGGLEGSKMGPMDLMLSLFAMKMMQDMSGATMTPTRSTSSPLEPTPARSAETCSQCGTTLPSGARFCPNCAAPVSGPKRCAKCGKELPSDAKFCPHCAEPVGRM